MTARTSTASISYITKHASFDKELKSPSKLNGEEQDVYSTSFFLQRCWVFFTSVHAFISHSFVNALCVDIFTQWMLRAPRRYLTSKQGHSVPATHFLRHGRVKFAQQRLEVEDCACKYWRVLQAENNNNDSKRNNSVCGLKICGLTRCKPVTFCSCCLQDATTKKVHGKSKPCS